MTDKREERIDNSKGTFPWGNESKRAVLVLSIIYSVLSIPYYLFSYARQTDESLTVC